PYAVVNWKEGFLSLKNGATLTNTTTNQQLIIQQHFNRNRKDIAHYAILGHLVAGPFNPSGVPCLADGVTCNPGVPPTTRSGMSDGWGGDFFVTLGGWLFDDPSDCNPDPTTPLAQGKVYCANFTGTANVQAGTIMHELGHNLGLRHAGLVSK